MLTAFRTKSTMASLVLAIVVSVPAHAQNEGGNEQMMNLVLQVQQLQDEIRSLRGQLEEQTFELETLKRRQRDQYLDLDQRISAAGNNPSPARGGMNGTSGPGSATASTAGARPSDQPRVDQPDVTERASTPSSVTALAAPETASSVVQATPEMEQGAYDQAFQALRELRYADASEEFSSFLNDYPDSSLASNAQYWLGESYYVTRNYEIALTAFQKLISQYPDSNKKGDGLLKIGFTHYELKQYDQSRAALEQVQKDFPNSTLSRLAESRLRSMRIEGQY